MNIVDALFGRPLATEEEKAERVGPLKGIPIFGRPGCAEFRCLWSRSRSALCTVGKLTERHGSRPPVGGAVRAGAARGADVTVSNSCGCGAIS